MRILIIEDEMHNYRMLHGMLQDIRPNWIILEHLVSVRKSVEWFSNHGAPDLVFMDIQLADGICFSIFEQVDITCPIIFTTAYDNYAIQAFKVNSVDYLLKPIKETELILSIEKFEQYYKPHDVAPQLDYAEIVNAIKSGEKKFRKRFLVQGNRSYHQLKTKDIAYFYSENKITTAVTFKNKQHVVDFTMDQLEDEIESEIFFRANRQFIVNIEAIDKIEDYFNGKLILKTIPQTVEPISISRIKAASFKSWMNR